MGFALPKIPKDCSVEFARKWLTLADVASLSVPIAEHGDNWIFA